MRKRIYILFLLLLSSGFSSIGICSAQTIQMEESQVSRLEQIFEKQIILSQQQDEKYKMVLSQLEKSESIIQLSQNKTNQLESQLMKANQLINQSQISLERVSKSYEQLERIKNREIKNLKIQNVGLIGIISYLIIK